MIKQHGIAQSFYIMGEIYANDNYDSRNYDKAMQNFKRSLEISQRINDPHAECHAEYNIGRLYSRDDYSKDYNEAIKHLQKGLKKSKYIFDRETTAKILNVMGKIEYDNGKVSDSIGHFGECLKTLREIQNGKGIIAEVLENIKSLKDKSLKDKSSDAYSKAKINDSGNLEKEISALYEEAKNLAEANGPICV
jgi:tetratricopeptide (TPR) repeat protein